PATRLWSSANLDRLGASAAPEQAQPEERRTQEREAGRLGCRYQEPSDFPTPEHHGVNIEIGLVVLNSVHQSRLGRRDGALGRNEGRKVCRRLSKIKSVRRVDPGCHPQREVITERRGPGSHSYVSGSKWGRQAAMDVRHCGGRRQSGECRTYL